MLRYAFGWFRVPSSPALYRYVRSFCTAPTACAPRPNRNPKSGVPSCCAGKKKSKEKEKEALCALWLYSLLLCCSTISTNNPHHEYLNVMVILSEVFLVLIGTRCGVVLCFLRRMRFEGFPHSLNARTNFLIPTANHKYAATLNPNPPQLVLEDVAEARRSSNKKEPKP